MLFVMLLIVLFLCVMLFEMVFFHFKYATYLKLIHEFFLLQMNFFLQRAVAEYHMALMFGIFWPFQLYQVISPTLFLPRIVPQIYISPGMKQFIRYIAGCSLSAVFSRFRHFARRF